MESPLAGAPSPPPGPAKIDTPGVVEALQGTRPWVRLIAIVGFVVTALMALLALVMPFLGLAGTKDLGGLGGGLVFFVVYGFGAVLYGAMSYFLYRYAAAIWEYLGNRTVGALEAALGYQKSFWRLLGIITAVYLALLVIFLVVIAIAAVVGVSRGA